MGKHVKSKRKKSCIRPKMISLMLILAILVNFTPTEVFATNINSKTVITQRQINDDEFLVKVPVDKFKEVESVKVSNGGKYELKGQDTEGNLIFRIYGGKPDEVLDNPKRYSKIVTETETGGEGSFNKYKSYNSEGYSGELTRVGKSKLISGTEIPYAEKYVTNQTTSNYNKDGFKGTLDKYLYSGEYVPAKKKQVNDKSSSNYSDSEGYKGTLDRYLVSGYYRPSESMHVTAQDSSSYNKGGFSGTLTRYLHSGTEGKTESKRMSVDITRDSFRAQTSTHEHWLTVTWPMSIKFNEDGWSGNLSRSGDKHDRGFVKLSGPREGNQFYTGWYIWTMTYSGTVTKKTPNTSIYKYQGTVTKPSSDTRRYAYGGEVVKPAEDNRIYRYRGKVIRPYKDNRVFEQEYIGTVYKPGVDNIYQHRITVKYKTK